jgi:hypothetical protein
MAPRVGPIVHRAIRPGNAFNSLLLITERRRVEIYVNSVAICDSVSFQWDLTPFDFAVASFVGESGKARAEFDNVKILDLSRDEFGLMRPRQKPR